MEEARIYGRKELKQELRYPLEKTLHKEDCKRVFKRYDADCPRCQELMGGAKPRDAWFTPQRVFTEIFKDCGHNALNPGGYCNVCGSGRDFS